MTAGQLIDFIRSILTNDDLETGHLLRLLNTAQEEASQILRAPTETVTYTAITDPTDLALPDDAQADGLLEVFSLSVDASGTITGSRAIPVYSFRGASQNEPNWTTQEPADTARFVVYDPANLGAHPFPVPPPSTGTTQSFRMVYVSTPDDMDTTNDQPFSGLLKPYHRMLAWKVAYYLTGEARFEAEYQRLLRRARGAVRPPATPVMNRLYKATMNTGRRS